MIELGRYEALRELVAHDFDTFSGFALERYFYWKFVEDTSYTRDVSRYSPADLKKVASFFAKHPQKREMNTAVAGLSIADM